MDEGNERPGRTAVSDRVIDVPAYKELVAKQMSEKQLQQFVIDTASHFGWLHYHTHDSRRSAAGFPDLVLVRDVELLFVELKAQRGRLRDEQVVWLRALEAACKGKRATEVHVWRPADQSVIVERLARRRSA